MTQLFDSELLNMPPERIAQWKHDTETAPGFPHFCIDNFLNEAFAREVASAYPSFEQASQQGRVFNKHYEKRKVQVTDSARFPAPVARLNHLLASNEFRACLSDVTGITDLLYDDRLGGGGMHLTQSGGRLDVHVDFNFIEDRGWYRRLNLLLYLNEEWKSEWGGALELWNADVSERIATFEPVFNRLCGFVTSEISYHGVTPITAPAGTTRKSFANYYYTTALGEGISSEHHSTIFKPRPDEAMRERLGKPVNDLKWKLNNYLDRARNKLGL